MSYFWYRVLRLTVSIVFAGFSGYWLYSILSKRKKEAKLKELEAANAANAIKMEYEGIMNTHKPIFALLADIADHGKGSAAVIPYGPNSYFYILFYNDKISLLTKAEPIVEFNLPVNLITTYSLSGERLYFYFKDPNVNHKKYPDDNFIKLIISAGKFNKYALEQIDYPEYLSENFTKVPKTTVNL